MAPERRLHGGRPSDNTLDANTPLTSAASEEKKVKVERGSGSPAVAFWKIFKESIHLYDLACGESTPERVAQPDVISQHSCESRFVLCQLPECEDIANTDEQRCRAVGAVPGR